ncbi:hypothetical protein KC921_05190 [Candidatus Woesebacteria bacterium]|nr:hypothetical protein [Candidatus Woesebacteria bacterium]
MSKKAKIPEFKSIAEEAAFWDTHSFTDFLDEMEPVKVNFAKKLSSGITVRFDDKTLNSIREEAHSKGMGATTLIRMWVLEKLKSGGLTKTSKSI